jgi:hypothetical protein
VGIEDEMWTFAIARASPGKDISNRVYLRILTHIPKSFDKKRPHFTDITVGACLNCFSVERV